MPEITSELIGQLMDGMALDFPEHVPGTRPVHAMGIAAGGEFRATRDAAAYCIAKQFDGTWWPATVRFSNGNGQPDPDGRLQVRGMAVKLHVGGSRAPAPEGAPPDRNAHAVGTQVEDLPIVAAEPGGAVEDTDLVCMSIPMFMAQRTEKLLDFAEAARPRPVRRPGLLKRLQSLATMCPLPPQEAGVTTSGNDGILAWSRRYVPAQGLVVATSMQRLPASYARTAYHAVHAFKITDPHGNRRMVRFAFEPADGVRSAGPPPTVSRSPIHAAMRPDLINEFGAAQPADFLREELRERLRYAPSRFNLRMQIADPYDDTSDPTKVWPMNRCRVLMGTLTLTHVVPDQVTGCEELSFNPGRLLDGVEMSDDPVLHDRAAIYAASYEQRQAARRARCPVA